jgi:hypothetical protein
VNLKKQAIMDFNSFQLSETDWLTNLSKTPGLAILVVDGFGKLVLLDNVTYLQENVFCAESKVLGLCGDDVHADVYRLDSKSASTAVEFSAPNWRDLKGVQSEVDVEALVVPDQNPSQTRLKLGLWVPPLVSLAILEAKSMLPAGLIPILSSKFQEFDHSSSSVKACTLFRPVLEYFWAVHKKVIPQTILAIDNGGDAVDWSSRMHFASISPVPLLGPPPPFPAPPAPFGQGPSSPFRFMTEELRKIRETNEKQLLHDANTTDSKKETNGWDKLPDMVQNMVLRLSALQDDVAPLEPCESFAKILKQSKVLGVASVLNLELALRKCQVDLPTSMVNAI